MKPAGETEKEGESSSRREPLLSSSTAATTSRSVDETTEEDEGEEPQVIGGAKAAPLEEEEESDDIGKQLSPLGSNSSSVQDVADRGPTKEDKGHGSPAGEMEEKSLTFSEEDSVSIPKVPVSKEARREGSSSANVSEVGGVSIPICTYVLPFHPHYETRIHL